MKNFTILFWMLLLLLAGIANGQAHSNRIKLHDLPPPEQSLAHEALANISTKDYWRLLLALEEAVEKEFYTIPLLVLDDLEEMPKRIALRSLRGVSDEGVIKALVEKLPTISPVPAGGGTEDMVARNITLFEYEKELANTFGLDLELKRDERVPIEIFQEALKNTGNGQRIGNEKTETLGAGANRPPKEVKPGVNSSLEEGPAPKDHSKWVWMIAMLILGLVLGMLIKGRK